ncbi:endo alpha-1,4 polygalactosaminidase [Hydrogenimonas urashimensis]|uniref:endo alpha-1,4 polygalactosaminidase n=1 Tax=Hydrogenimonas urashimensis TaxID=2740515 RepID=UPI00191580B8|nr:endo alpha-1,4 polygalactosaminidase [Hydrogenimonas urashimensis]
MPTEASADERGVAQKSYPLHENITSTIFWIGEEASADNGGIANVASVWDEKWMERYGGVDTPDRRNGYLPAAFKPMENPFYAALPFNDFDENGERKPDLSATIPWYEPGLPKERSYCKNRWIEIVKDGKRAYAQWEDAGPFGEDDAAYVFGNAAPKNTLNANAGIDLSPAVRDYLGLKDIDWVDWRFVEEEDVPQGPWKEVPTLSGVGWPLWYRPAPNTTWQWQLQKEVNISYDVEVYDIDLFDSGTDRIEALHRDGRKVVCYFSAGSYEEWREDAGSFPSDAVGLSLEGWAGERWLDIRSEEVRNIMVKRLDLARIKGCDAVEPDNVDGYANDTGFTLSAKDQLDYNRFLADEAHKRGLAVALKNDLDQVEALEPWFDFALNEECHIYEECDLLEPFIKAGKPVFNAEYAQMYRRDPEIRRQLCDDAKRRGFHTLILPLDLDDTFRYSCE